MTDVPTVKRAIFMTGFPGFLGYHLLESLLQEWPEATFHLLVQPLFVEKAEAELGLLQGKYENVTNRVSIIPGDIAAANLGLPAKSLLSLFGAITHVFHLAAIYDLAVPKKIAYQVNVNGTIHILDALERMPNLQKFIYFSTCYVAGTRTGKIYEEELDQGQKFKNYYEETKFKAELEVRARMDRIPTIIIRPSIVAGNSLTGAIPKFDGPYYILRLFAKLEKSGLLPKGIFLPHLGKGRAKLNVVPVDFLVPVVVAAVQSEQAVGKTFQVADPNPIEVRVFYKYLLKSFGLRALGMVPSSLIENLVKLPGVPDLLGIPAEVFIYFNHEADFDTSNVNDLVKGQSLRCPSPLDYLQPMVEFTRKTI